MQYQHGGDIYTREIDMDYSANLNPLGLPDGVRKVLESCIHTDVCSVYPDSRCGKLRRRWAGFMKCRKNGLSVEMERRTWCSDWSMPVCQGEDW